MPSLDDQLIEIAREKRRKRRSTGVHKSISSPIVVLLLGDKQLDALDTLYTQLRGRWSSHLNALQVCYCYVESPYTGANPILQVKLELPEDCGGQGAVCAFPNTLAAINDMMAQAIDRISQEAQVQMVQAGIHIVLAPEDPAGVLLSDLAAVAKGRLEDFGSLTNDCKLYLMLPRSYQTRDECERVCGVMDQLQQAKQYEQPVLQPQLDAAPRMYQVDRLVDAVMLLDDLNENNQHYNLHGERLGLLLDLVENGWSNTAGFIQTAGIREGSAGPEYWLAQATDQLCSERQAEGGKSEDDERFQVIDKEIIEAVQARLQGVQGALQSCCLFRRGQVGRIARSPLDDGEAAVFGSALHTIYASWKESATESEIPGAILQIVEAVESDAGLDALIEHLESWAANLEEQPLPRPKLYCPQVPSDRGEAEAARYFRDILWTEKYQPLMKQEEQDCCAKLARLCVRRCRLRKEELSSEEEEFAGFAEAIKRVWYDLRSAYNDGGKLEPKWIGKRPASGALRKAGALAYRTGDPTEVLSMVAECVDLGGTEAKGAPKADPVLFCRIPLANNLATYTKPITEGISAGCILKFAVVSQQYDEEAMRRVHALNYAREQQALD